MKGLPDAVAFAEMVRASLSGPDDSEAQVLSDQADVVKDVAFGMSLARGPLDHLIDPPNYSRRSGGSDVHVDTPNNLRYMDYVKRLSLIQIDSLDFAFRVDAGLKARARILARRKGKVATIRDLDQSCVRRLKMVV